MMKPLRSGSAAFIASLVLVLDSSSRSAEPHWDQAAARNYLDGRTQQWMAWSEAKDAGPKALACSGILRGDTGGMMLRFVAGRPVSPVPV